MRLNLFLLIGGLLAMTCGWSAEEAPASAAAKRIGVAELEKLRGNTNVVILDVRTKDEFAKGRIPGAVNLDINSLRFMEMAGALDKSKIYVVNCAVGMRSARACKKLEPLGFKELYDFAPGFDGWKKERKPVEK